MNNIVQISSPSGTFATSVEMQGVESYSVKRTTSFSSIHKEVSHSLFNEPTLVSSPSSTFTSRRNSDREDQLDDTHTATGWAVAEDYVNQTGDNAPMVVLSTASPYKFPAAVLSSLEDVPQMDEFQQMERLEAVSGVKIPENLAGLQEKKELHTSVIEKTTMLEFVMGL